MTRRVNPIGILEKYENKSVSKVAQKAKSDGKTEDLAIDCTGGGSLRGSNMLEGATFKDVDLRRCKLATAIEKSKFINVNLEGYDLSNKTMNENTKSRNLKASTITIIDSNGNEVQRYVFIDNQDNIINEKLLSMQKNHILMNKTKRRCSGEWGGCVCVYAQGENVC